MPHACVGGSTAVICSRLPTLVFAPTVRITPAAAMDAELQEMRPPSPTADSVQPEASDDEHTPAEQEAGASEIKPLAVQTDCPSAESPAEVVTKKKVARTRKPSIDLDAAISDATSAMKAAQKRVQQWKAQAKNDRRKKQRLLKKAASLKPEDLERIAVLKRCGFVRSDGTVAHEAQPLVHGGAAPGDAPSTCSAGSSTAAPPSTGEAKAAKIAQDGRA